MARLSETLPWTGHWQARRRDYSQATMEQLRERLGADHVAWILAQRCPVAVASGRSRGCWDANDLEAMSAYDRLAALLGAEVAS